MIHKRILWLDIDNALIFKCVKLYDAMNKLFFLFFFSIAIQAFAGDRDFVKLLIIPTHADWNYSVREEASVKVLAYAGGLPLDGVTITFESGNDMMPADLSGKVSFKAGETMLRLGTMTQPGFRYCRLHFVYEGRNYREQVKVAFSPQDISPTVVLPKDFESFWKKSILEVKKVPLKLELKVLPESSTDKVEVSLLKLTFDEYGNSIYGYFCKPKKPGRHPVLLVPPGAGVKRITFSTEYAEQGFISLFMDVHGLSPLADSETVKQHCDQIGDYIYIGLAAKERYYYKKVYLSCVRAMDYLCSLPEFDGVNAGVCGGSQGGALAIVTAALDSRVRFLSSFYPALCDMTGFDIGRAGGWPKLFSSSDASKLTVEPEIARQTMAYYDVVNFARFIKVPGFYSFGYNDNTCPPTTVSAALNAITAPKVVKITPLSAHWRFDETNRQAIEWMKEQSGMAVNAD